MVDAINAEDSFTDGDWATFCSIVAAAGEEESVDAVIRAIRRAARTIGSDPVSPFSPWMEYQTTFCIPKGKKVNGIGAALMCRVVRAWCIIEVIHRVPVGPSLAAASGRASDDIHSRLDEMKKNPQFFVGDSAQFASAPIGDYILWATFAIDGPTSPPLPLSASGKKLKRAEVAAVLGLPREWSDPNSGPLLAIGYKSAKIRHPTKPSIAHAYAGPWWNRYFRPNPGAEYGETCPWPECRLPGQPELVHEPITLGDCDLDAPFPIFFED